MVVSLPFLGMGGIAAATAKPTKSINCAKPKNQNKPACKNGGKGGSPPPLITIDPQPGGVTPLVETGQSEVHFVIQVETSPSFAGQPVNIDSSQLSSSCATLSYENLQIPGGGNNANPVTLNVSTTGHISSILDNDGNATVVADGTDCAPGSDVMEADLQVAPFYTAITTLTVAPPMVTPVGVAGYPRIAGGAGEVETGDTLKSGDSNVYAVFYVETDPVYAEQSVEIDSTQLDGRCIKGWIWEPGNALGVGVGVGYSGPIRGVGINTGTKPSTIIDNDGNAVFVFKGVSCASGVAVVIADVLAGSHPTYTTTFTVEPPAPTI
jgi:hypothetical protein